MPKIRVTVAPRTMPGSSESYPGYGAAGLYFPNGTSEHDVTDEQLAELKALKRPFDDKGRPQVAPFDFVGGDGEKAENQQPAKVLSSTSPQSEAHGAGTPTDFGSARTSDTSSKRK